LPGFLDWLADVSNGTPGNQDLVLVARGTGAPDPDVAPEPDWPSHERAAHGARLRREVSGWRYGGDRGIILLGRGLVDRFEMAYEVDAAAPPGTGRLLARAALGLVTPGEPVFAQVAPGHARSLRATLAAGYQPIGSEILFAKGSV
jgi:hypothetical protein